MNSVQEAAGITINPTGLARRSLRFAAKFDPVVSEYWADAIRGRGVRKWANAIQEDVGHDGVIVPMGRKDAG